MIDEAGISKEALLAFLRENGPTPTANITDRFGCTEDNAIGALSKIKMGDQGVLRVRILHGIARGLEWSVDVPESIGASVPAAASAPAPFPLLRPADWLRWLVLASMRGRDPCR